VCASITLTPARTARSAKRAALLAHTEALSRVDQGDGSDVADVENSDNSDSSTDDDDAGGDDDDDDDDDDARHTSSAKRARTSNGNKRARRLLADELVGVVVVFVIVVCVLVSLRQSRITHYVRTMSGCSVRTPHCPTRRHCSSCRCHWPRGASRGGGCVCQPAHLLCELCLVMYCVCAMCLTPTHAQRCVDELAERRVAEQRDGGAHHAARATLCRRGQCVCVVRCVIRSVCDGCTRVTDVACCQWR
jgi:hypothetical protein